jgi:hypothetical protein
VCLGTCRGLGIVTWRGLGIVPCLAASLVICSIASNAQASPSLKPASNAQASPKPVQSKVDKKQNQSGAITLDFPSDRSMGSLFTVDFVSAKNNVSYSQKFFAMARGPIHVPGETKLRLKISYQGGEDASSLARIQGKSIVSVNCRRIESINDESIMYISQMPGVLQLFLDETDISDKSLISISHMKELTELTFPETGVTAKGLDSLAELTSLNILVASANDLGDAAMPKLLPLKQLHSLNLDRTKLSDVGVKVLSKLNNLTFLNICKNPHVTNAGIAYLVALPKLESLDVSQTAITIDVLPHLKKMKSLKFFTCQFCKISKDDLQTMKKSLPNCYISTEVPPRVDPAVFTPLH